MIKEIFIQNYQSHKKTTLEFCLGVNSIIGSSNSGKTAILRALLWAVYNRPSGLSFVSHWNQDKSSKPIKPTEVKVILDNGIISRIREKDGNYYEVNSKKLEAVGLDVPDEVSKLFNLDSVNIQKQMDAPFLLSESAGEVARFFNATIRLDLIDRVLSKAESKRREANKEKVRLEQEANEIDAEIGTFTWIEEAERLTSKIEVKEKAIEKKEDEVEALENYVDEYKEYQETIEECEAILAASPLIEKIEILQESLKKKVEQQSKLKLLVVEWKKQKSVIDNTIDFSKVSNLVTEIDDFRKAIYEKVQSLEKLKGCVEEYKEKQNNIITYTFDIQKYEKELPTVCPTCLKPLNEDKCK